MLRGALRLLLGVPKDGLLLLAHDLRVAAGVEGVDKAGQVEGVEAALHERRVETGLVHVERVGQQLAHRLRRHDHPRSAHSAERKPLPQQSLASATALYLFEVAVALWTKG